MESILKELVGKKIDVNCGSNAAYRGTVLSVDNGILTVRNEEEQKVMIAVEKIAAVCEYHDPASRPGFIS